MAEFEGDLYVAGRFRRLRGGDYASDVALWDGDQWKPIDAEINGVGHSRRAVHVMVAHDDGLYLGGSFKSAGNVDGTSGIARWDGSSFHSIGGGVIVEQYAGDSRVNAIAFVGDDLYIGGRFDGRYAAPAGTNIARIARWDGAQWHSLAGETAIAGKEVQMLAAVGSDLYVAGHFLSADGIPASDKLARWDGSRWHAVGGGGLKTTPRIEVHDGELYAAARFHDFHNIPDTYELGRWDGSQWHPVGNMFSDSYIYTLYSASVTGELYIGGTFDVAGTGPNTARLARLVSGKWHSAAGFEPRIGLGLNFQVNVLATDGSDVYAGGAFGDAGANTRADRIARWDGTRWHNLGTPPLDAVSSIAIHKGEVYAASYRSYLDRFTLGRFDGTEWHRVTGTYRGIDLALNGAIHALDFNGDQLYAGGQFFSYLGLSNIAMWDGASWNDLNGGVPGLVRSIVATDSAVYVAGDFVLPNGTDQNYGIAVWNGAEWMPLGPTLEEKSYIKLMAMLDGYLYIVGSDKNGWFIKRYNGIDLTDITPFFPAFDTNIFTLQVLGNDLFVGGEFASVDGIPGTSGFARYDGERWHSYAGGTSGTVLALASTDEGLYIGGKFASVGADSIASLNIAFHPNASVTSNEEDTPGDDAPGLDGTFELSVPHPNPTTADAQILLHQQRTALVRVSLYDMMGREIYVAYEGVLEANREHTLALPTGRLASGIYLVRAEGEGERATRMLTVTR